MKKILRTFFYGAAPLFLLALARHVSADPGVPAGGSIAFPNPIKSPSLQCLISDILKIVANLGAVIAVFFIIYSGFLFITAQGDTKKVSDARNTFLYTIIGTAILLGAWGLSSIIATTIGKVTNTTITFTGCK